jgi:uncharacterized phage protein gp47/JayE
MAIQIINNGSSNVIVRQLWIGDTAEELRERTTEQLRYWPPQGYGTSISVPKSCESVPGVERYKGKFFVNFSRYTSCD